MKKVLLIIAISSLFSCENERTSFEGYLVCKEYTEPRMSNQSEKVHNYAIMSTHFTPRPVVIHHTPPHYINAKYVWYLANKKEVISINVNKKMFNKHKCGTFIKYNF
jgi:uncharacterized membrane protein